MIATVAFEPAAISVPLLSALGILSRPTRGMRGRVGSSLASSPAYMLLLLVSPVPPSALLYRLNETTPQRNLDAWHLPLVRSVVKVGIRIPHALHGTAAQAALRGAWHGTGL
jgi:hypothetical protein